MAETMKLSGKRESPNECDEISSYMDCMCVLFKLLVDFSKELKLGDGALRIEVNTSAIPLSTAANVYSCLQEHITNLQAVSQSLKTLVDADAGRLSTEENTSADAVTICSYKQQANAQIEHHSPSSESAERKNAPDDAMVQIRAGKSEIERRISAFMERKQMEINENNVREFCNVIDCNQENSCARTDAVFTPYPGFKSHVKVTRVVNTYGPQTRGGKAESGDQQRGLRAGDCGNTAIEERLHNIETHLKLPAVGPVPFSVYQRLKKLEDRILELEGLSPEYFQSTGLMYPHGSLFLCPHCVTTASYPQLESQQVCSGPKNTFLHSHLHKRPKTSPSQACSLTELDEKISAVKAALLRKVNEFGPGYGAECPL